MRLGSGTGITELRRSLALTHSGRLQEVTELRNARIFLRLPPDSCGLAAGSAEGNARLGSSTPVTDLRRTVFLVFEGPDASGKTTLARGLASRWGGVYTSSIPPELAHIRAEADGLPAEDRLRFYQLCNALVASRIGATLAGSSRPIILDRWIFSTVAYNESLVSRSLASYAKEILAEDRYARPDAVVYVTADPETRLERATREDTKNLWFDVSLQRELVARYDKVLAAAECPVVVVDTSYLRPNHALDQCEQELAAEGVIWRGEAQ